MNNESSFYMSQMDDEPGLEWDRSQVSPAYCDDSFGGQSSARLDALMDTVTRVGGEVARMRVEIDELLMMNREMQDAFAGLRAVIEAKGVLDMDDFELACDVLEASGSSRRPRRSRDAAQ